MRGLIGNRQKIIIYDIFAASCFVLVSCMEKQGVWDLSNIRQVPNLDFSKLNQDGSPGSPVLNISNECTRWTNNLYNLTIFENRNYFQHRFSQWKTKNTPFIWYDLKNLNFFIFFDLFQKHKILFDRAEWTQNKNN